MSDEKKKDYLCDSDCNNCEAIRNQQVALLLNVLALRFGQEVWHITNSICPNLTCCPICHIDDFCHDCSDAKSDSGIAAIDEIGKDAETCAIARAALEYITENKLCKSNS